MVVIIGGVYFAKSGEKSGMDVATEEKKMMFTDGQGNTTEVESSATWTDKQNIVDVVKEDMMKAGLYESYVMSKIAMAESKDVVLFFRASWCPSCRALDSDLKANLSAIPGGLAILDVDYDKETELKKKYGVTYQHTLVQVDKDGNMIKKWSGGSTLSSIVSQVQ